jgi:hypothetical protein
LSAPATSNGGSAELVVQTGSEEIDVLLDMVGNKESGGRHRSAASAKVERPIDAIAVVGRNFVKRRPKLLMFC